jgi:hypothetical protein
VGSLSPVQTVREYSFLENPRTPAALTASTSFDELQAASPGTEIERLRKAHAGKKVLHLKNVHAVDTVKEYLTYPQALAFKSKFGFVRGDWCCAPNADSKRGQPQNSFFSLMRPGAMAGFGRFG